MLGDHPVGQVRSPVWANRRTQARASPNMQASLPPLKLGWVMNWSRVFCSRSLTVSCGTKHDAGHASR